MKIRKEPTKKTKDRPLKIRPARLAAAALAVALALPLCAWSREASKYADKENWAALEADLDRPVDVFFIAPTVETGLSGNFNMSLEDDSAREQFLETVNMGRGLWEQTGRVFAPYYEQASFTAYLLSKEESAPYFNRAYRDVKDAFCYYMEEYNGGRPFILAGYSQGAEMAVFLMKDLFDEEKYRNLLVAAYCPGWPVTEEDVAQYPWLEMAKGELDTGVIVSFNSEAAGVGASPLVPAGMKALSINPLNWKTDGTLADKSENLGACFVDGSGKIASELPNFTGAYLDTGRGTLKIVDVKMEDYPSFPFPQGVYHSYEFQFFYRNLQKNAADRTRAYLERAGKGRQS